MWTGIILACGANACMVFTGPMVGSEQQCFETVNMGALYVQLERPDLRLIDFKCIDWSEPV